MRNIPSSVRKGGVMRNPIARVFTGADGRDLIEAKALLDTL
jgi:hypothetical protein